MYQLDDRKGEKPQWFGFLAAAEQLSAVVVALSKGFVTRLRRDLGEP